MTRETRIIMGLDDIKAVTFECGNDQCKTRVTMSPDNFRIPHRCPDPECGHDWQGDVLITQETPASPYPNFCRVVAEIRMRLKKDVPVPFKILLEFEAQP